MKVGKQSELAEAEKDRAQQWFEDNFDGNACIMCTQLTLKLGPIHSIAVGHEPKAAWYVVVECSECGHALFYNAETIGVLIPKE